MDVTFCWWWFLICALVVAQTDPQVKTVQSGGDVLLPCRGPRRDDIVFIQWIRPDLESEGSVFFFRDDLILEIYQHPSFRGRVNLTDPQMKDGDASVILKNVTINDTGTYECYVGIRGNSPQLINTITLQVKGGGDGHAEVGGDKEGGRLYIELITGVFVPVMMIVFVFVFVLIKVIQRHRNDSHLVSPDQSSSLRPGFLPGGLNSGEGGRQRRITRNQSGSQ